MSRAVLIGSSSVVPRVPVYTPTTTPEDARAAAEAIRTGALSGTAPIVGAFERAWAARCGMPHGVAVSNGTAALELAVAALGVGPGDEVLCPAFTIISCARAIVLAGATPILVDVDPTTFCIDVAETASRIGPRTRAVLGVHMFGHPYDHSALVKLAERHGFAVIEDAAQAHGARVYADNEWLACGGLGDVATFSFYANKAITTGEGGMVLARQSHVAQRARHLANLATSAERRFLHDELGHNYRLSSVQAALGLAQMTRLDEIVATKRRVAACYRELLVSLAELRAQAVMDWAEPAFWMNAVVLSDALPFDARDVSTALDERGIETRPFFIGLHEQPALRDRGLFSNDRHPVTEDLSRRGLYLPSGLDLDEATLERVVNALRDALVACRARATSKPKAEVTATVESAPFGQLYAEAYDILYAEKPYAAEVNLLERSFRLFSNTPVRRVLDVGCGTGRHAAELVARGYDVVGVDRSEPMLERARARLPQVTFVNAEASRLELGKAEGFDAVVMLFAVLSYAPSAAAVVDQLRAARRMLQSGGLLVADVWLGGVPARGTAVTRRTASSGAVSWERTGRLTANELEQRVHVSYELVRREGAEVQLARERHELHYFFPSELELALELADFELLRLSSTDDLERPPVLRELSAMVVARARAVADSRAL